MVAMRGGVGAEKGRIQLHILIQIWSTYSALRPRPITYGRLHRQHRRNIFKNKVADGEIAYALITTYNT